MEIATRGFIPREPRYLKRASKFIQDVDYVIRYEPSIAPEVNPKIRLMRHSDLTSIQLSIHTKLFALCSAAFSH